MTPLLLVLLFLHVISAIVAFGPTFAFPLIGGMGQRHPQHAAFAVEVSERIETRMVVPVALTMPITGVAMIIVAEINPFTTLWLAIAIILYVIAIAYAILVQTRAVAELAAALRELSAGVPPPAGAPAGPPAHIAALGARVNRGGQLLAILVVAIVFLMVTKLSF